METINEVVKVILTFSLSFLFALVVSRLLLSGLLRGLSTAPRAEGCRAPRSH
jgi:hypothetical protein